MLESGRFFYRQGRKRLQVMMRCRGRHDCRDPHELLRVLVEVGVEILDLPGGVQGQGADTKATAADQAQVIVAAQQSTTQTVDPTTTQPVRFGLGNLNGSGSE